MLGCLKCNYDNCIFIRERLYRNFTWGGYLAVVHLIYSIDRQKWLNGVPVTFLATCPSVILDRHFLNLSFFDQ